ncbi:MAG: hypothetical protein IT581_22180 [Verrucomicrobiales bacterium]|nr:hypothetical protein [Verrucomicrobiales bacterium]
MIGLFAQDAGAPEAALGWVLRIAAVGVIVYGIEMLAIRRILRDDGLMGWEIGSLRFLYFTRGWSAKFWNAWLRYPVFRMILVVRVVLGFVVLTIPAQWILHPALILPTWWALFLFTKRNHYGQDGADQMLLIVFTAAALVSLHVTPLTCRLALWVVALQCALAYTAAGIAKLTAGGWRDGRFLPGIFATQIYGMPGVHRILSEHRSLAVGLSWLVMLWESLFPLAFLLPWPFGLGFVAVGVGFHLANAVTMGLGSFFVAFLSTYPALIFCLRTKGW